jgi:hypothetical protein
MTESNVVVCEKLATSENEIIDTLKAIACASSMMKLAYQKKEMSSE